MLDLSLKIIKSERISILATYLFLFNPSSVFFNSIYTENIFCFF